MFRVELGVSYGFRFKVLGLVSALAVMAASADPADARARQRGAKAHHRSATAARYSPPYAAIVVDANSGASLHESSADNQRHPASLTKIMTLYLLFEQLEAGNLKLDSELDVSAHAASMAPSKLGLKPGTTVRVDDAIRALVTKSANDVAAVIAEAVGENEPQFARVMTRKARALGMTRTIYRNASGLPNPEQVTTARDQALLGRAIQDRFPKYYRYFATPSFVYRGHAMRNHNKLLGQVQGVDGIKTGYIQASGFNLVTSVRRANRHIVAVVLGGASARSRDARMRDLIDSYIGKGAAVRTVAAITESSESASAPQVATFVPVAARPAPQPVAPSPAVSRQEPVATATVSTPAGSSDDIKPIAVRTIRVKANTLQTAAIGSVSVAAMGTAKSAPLAARSVPEPVEVVGKAKSISLAPIEKAERAAPEPTAANAIAVQIAAVDTTAPSPRAAEVRAHTGWIIQVGALESISEAKARLATAQTKARTILAHADAFTEQFVKGDKTFYRARFAGLGKQQAEAACKSLKRSEIACIAVKN